MKTNSLGPMIADLEGVELSQLDKEVLCHPKLGGIIFFSRNFESREQLADLVRCIREVRPNILLCVDQEGGRVQRFKEGFTRIPAMARVSEYASVHKKCPQTLFENVGWLMAAELVALDIDHSFAPVLDIHHAQSSVIGDRAFACDAEDVSAYCRAFIRGMGDAGMAATAKHFPGHGGVTEDSHLELPVDARPFADILHRDMLPFEQLKTEYAALMTAHIVFSAVDDQPVSFSKRWLRDILRGDMHYQGVVLSDDLSMKGAANVGDYFERAQLALMSGCDAILLCNQREQAEYVLEKLEANQLGEYNALCQLKRAPARLTQAQSKTRKQEILKDLASIEAGI